MLRLADQYRSCSVTFEGIFFTIIMKKKWAGDQDQCSVARHTSGPGGANGGESRLVTKDLQVSTCSLADEHRIPPSPVMKRFLLPSPYRPPPPPPPPTSSRHIALTNLIRDPLWPLFTVSTLSVPSVLTSFSPRRLSLACLLEITAAIFRQNRFQTWQTERPPLSLSLSSCPLL